MSAQQLDLDKMAPQKPEDIIRENLERAMIRYKGNINAYYAELLKKVPEVARDTQWNDLRRVAALRLRARR